jgi:hypothetical protein
LVYDFGMSLGEAFIEVRADTRPFSRDLDRQVKLAAERAETGLTRTLTHSLGNAGEKAGEEAGDRAGRSMRRRLRHSVDNDRNLFLSLVGALGSALDDGISALPTEIKAAIVLGLVLALPEFVAMLGGAVVAGMGLAVTGLGILLAAQFDEVQKRATEVFGHVRAIMALSAESFGPAVISALDLIEGKVLALQPTLRTLFEGAAGFVEPLTATLLEGISSIVDVLAGSIDKIRPFVDIFATGLQSTLETVAEGLERLANTGVDGQEALKELFDIINVLIGAIFGLIEGFIHLNAAMHDVFDFIVDIIPGLRQLENLMRKDMPEANGAIIVSNFNTKKSFEGLVTATTKQEQAVKELIKAMDDLVESTFNNIQVDIDFERSLDNLSDSLDKNGKNLDIHSEKGRQNVEAFMKGLKDAEKAALDKLQTQGYTTEQASQFYNQEVAQLRALAREAGISDAKFDELFGQIVEVSQLRLNPDQLGISDINASMAETLSIAMSLLDTFHRLARISISGGVAGALVGRYADGDIVDRPTLGIFGEAGPEVIIPLTKPSRAAELANKSGLSAMIGNNGNVTMVFIGEEQLESRMVKVVERNNHNQALALGQGPRRF